MNNSIKQFLSEAGKKGGAARAAKYGKKKLSEWAKLGGRPKKKLDKQV